MVGFFFKSSGTEFKKKGYWRWVSLEQIDWSVIGVGSSPGIHWRLANGFVIGTWNSLEVCNKCGKKGHSRDECWRREEKMEEQAHVVMSEGEVDMVAET